MERTRQGKPNARDVGRASERIGGRPQTSLSGHVRRRIQFNQWGFDMDVEQFAIELKLVRDGFFGRWEQTDSSSSKRLGVFLDEFRGDMGIE